MISALQHYLFCPRRCALVHIEQQWQENRLTAEGRILHERVHGGGRESRRTLRVEYDVPIRSLRLGLIGRADIVEFHRQDDGPWQPLPVEYKRGRPKKDDIDRVQLCAQAICLEEMLDCVVPEGALYYGLKKRRTTVVFDAGLRDKTVQTAAELHALLAKGRTPPPQYDKRCESCSFLPLCLPRVATRKQVGTYLRRMVRT
ncbi:CRISPR-associated protein Cas4 [Desulfobulbus alkaliphilus]|uniref:CRISPR-associated protein Cas4 n=1 Tax=Desulfobulbus alkaliphilus TaxID=869814 RepID=UPI001F0710DC|nr:CRISPR-associated protein Cas4 [Desulfobulbus alkaliphilus]